MGLSRKSAQLATTCRALRQILPLRSQGESESAGICKLHSSKAGHLNEKYPKVTSNC